MIGKHHATRAETYPGRHRAYVRDQDFGAGACDAGHVVVLGVPEPRVAEAIKRLRKLSGVTNALALVPPRTSGTRSSADRDSMLTILLLQACRAQPEQSGFVRRRVARRWLPRSTDVLLQQCGRYGP